MATGMGKYMAHATGIYGYGWAFELIILLLFFLIVYWIIKSSIKNESAIEILNKRYAKGEISKGEYQNLKKDILEAD